MQLSHKALSHKALLTLLVIPAALGLAARPAQAQINLNFENLSNPNNAAGFNNQGGSVTQNGFTITDTSGTNSLSSVSPNKSIFDYTGSVALFQNSFQGVTKLTQNNGLAFTLNSIDIANLALQSSIPNTTTVVFTGDVQGGGTVMKTFTSSANDSLQTVTFSNFTNLLSVSFAQQFPSNQFDNISVTAAPAVPEASTTVSFGLLLALGLGGLVVAAKRKKAAPSL